MEDQQYTPRNHAEEAIEKILLVDDHQRTREALAEQIESHPGWSVVAEAASGEEAIEAVKVHKPRIITMDMHMPGMNGLEASKVIVRMDPSVKVLIISNFDDVSLVKAAFQAGAKGYINKQSAFEELLPGLEALAEGKQYICSTIKLKLT